MNQNMNQNMNQDMDNESISKALEAALKSFEAKTNEVTEGYFDQFELDLMQKIKATTEAPKKATIVSMFSNQKKYLVAASLVVAIATGYLLLNKANNDTTTIAQVATIDIETLPDEVIEAYVYNNEPVAEVEWNSAIEAVGSAVGTTVHSSNN